MYYRNEGARFTTTAGESVDTGDVFEAGPRDPDVTRRRHKLTPVTGIELPPAVELEGIEFGSEPARKLALREGLTSADFQGVEPSGATGYVLGDVRGLL